MVKILTQWCAALIFIVAPMVQANIKASVDDSFDSKILKQTRPLVVSLPKSYDSSKDVRYPVLYLLDGPHNIAHTAGSLGFLADTGMAPEMIIVGIANINRGKDLTPDKDSSMPGESGGGEQLLDFIESELIPYISKKYRTGDYKIFAGHSLGGLMAIHAMQSRPHLFQAHFAYSPSLWYNGESTLKQTDKMFKANPDYKGYLYVNLANETGAMKTAFDKFKLLLKNHAPKGLDHKIDVFENETHSTVPAIGQVLAYRDLFAHWRMPKDYKDKSIAGIKAFYGQQSVKYGYTIVPDEVAVNIIGYQLLHDSKDIKTAVEVFKFNVQNYPNSANTYDSLADALEADGDIKNALKQMNKVMALVDKSDTNYQVFLEHQQRLNRL